MVWCVHYILSWDVKGEGKEETTCTPMLLCWNQTQSLTRTNKKCVWVLWGLDKEKDKSRGLWCYPVNMRGIDSRWCGPLHARFTSGCLACANFCGGFSLHQDSSWRAFRDARGRWKMERPYYPYTTAPDFSGSSWVGCIQPGILRRSREK